MPDERVIQQVSGILGMNDVKFRTDESKRNFLVPIGSAGVFISFVDWGEHTIIGVRAILLQEVDGSGERKHKILETLNEKNRTVPFGTFYFDPDSGFVLVDHHLFGDQLQTPELMNALTAIGSMADELDDELRETIGSGVRAADAWNAAHSAASETEGAGPVVDT